MESFILSQGYYKSSVRNGVLISAVGAIDFYLRLCYLSEYEFATETVGQVPDEISSGGSGKYTCWSWNHVSALQCVSLLLLGFVDCKLCGGRNMQFFSEQILYVWKQGKIRQTGCAFCMHSDFLLPCFVCRSQTAYGASFDRCGCGFAG